jgi:hypothetical protein
VQSFGGGTWIEPEVESEEPFGRNAMAMMPDGTLQMVSAGNVDTAFTIPAMTPGGTRGTLSAGRDRVLRFHLPAEPEALLALYRAPVLKGTPVAADALPIDAEEVGGRSVSRARDYHEVAWAMGPFRAAILDDDSPNNPREDDNLSVMAFWASSEGDKDHHISRRDFNGPQATFEAIKEKIGDGIILPVIVYEHSDVSFHLGSYNGPDARWDSRPAGFMYVGIGKIHEEFGVEELDEKTREAVIEGMRTELKEYENYVRNNAHGFVVEKPDGTAQDTCWGYLGDVDESSVREVALESLEGSYRNWSENLASPALLLDEEPDPALGDGALVPRAVLGVLNPADEEQHRIVILHPGEPGDGIDTWTLKIISDAPENERSPAHGVEIEIGGDFEAALKKAKLLAYQILRSDYPTD